MLKYVNVNVKPLIILFHVTGWCFCLVALYWTGATAPSPVHKCHRTGKYTPIDLHVLHY